MERRTRCIRPTPKLVLDGISFRMKQMGAQKAIQKFDQKWIGERCKIPKRLPIQSNPNMQLETPSLTYQGLEACCSLKPISIHYCYLK